VSSRAAERLSLPKAVVADAASVSQQAVSRAFERADGHQGSLLDRFPDLSNDSQVSKNGRDAQSAAFAAREAAAGDVGECAEACADPLLEGLVAW